MERNICFDGDNWKNESTWIANMERDTLVSKVVKEAETKITEVVT